MILNYRQVVEYQMTCHSLKAGKEKKSEKTAKIAYSEHLRQIYSGLISPVFRKTPVLKSKPTFSLLKLKSFNNKWWR